jgi:hypothetical protein
MLQNSNKRLKTQPGDALVTPNSYQSPVNHHSDLEHNVARDFDSMSILFSLIFPTPVQKYIEEKLKFHASRMFSPTDSPSLNEMDAVVPSMMSAYADAQARYSSVLPNQLYIKEVPCKTTMSALHDAYLVDCVLARTYKKARPNHVSSFSDTVLLTRTSKELCLSRNDNMFRTFVVVVPLAGVFYTKSSPNCSLNITGRPLFQIAPLPASWLRLQLKNGIPAVGSFIKRFNRIWSIDFSDHSQCSFQPCFQFFEKIPNAPLLPATTLQGSTGNTVRTPKLACHNNLKETCFHYDPLVQGDVVFHVTILEDDGRPEYQSVVKVTTARDFPELMMSLVHGSNLLSSMSGVRRNICYQVGLRGIINVECLHSDSPTSATLGYGISDLSLHLPVICRNALHFANQKFPGVSPLINHMETMANTERPSLLGGTDGVSSTMSISFDSANPTHVDLSSGSVGFFVASESSPGLDPGDGWKFVLPNVCLTVAGKDYVGLSIRLSHGCSVLLDGRIIRHGTSCHTTNSNNHRMGWFWCLSGKTFASAMGKVCF